MLAVRESAYRRSVVDGRHETVADHVGPAHLQSRNRQAAGSASRITPGNSHKPRLQGFGRTRMTPTQRGEHVAAPGDQPQDQRGNPVIAGRRNQDDSGVKLRRPSRAGLEYPHRLPATARFPQLSTVTKLAPRLIGGQPPKRTGCHHGKRHTGLPQPPQDCRLSCPLSRIPTTTVHRERPNRQPPLILYRP